jgi:hypothetical protein
MLVAAQQRTTFHHPEWSSHPRAETPITPSVSEFMARVQGAREEHDRSGRTVERLFNCNRRLAKDVEATS